MTYSHEVTEYCHLGNVTTTRNLQMQNKKQDLLNTMLSDILSKELTRAVEEGTMKGKI